MTTTGLPLVFAHRGSSAELPEHTLDAYLKAIEDGADGLECDVRLTRDGHLVCIHDGRLDRTSNGRGRVSATTLEDLERLDFGSWHPSLAVGRPREAVRVLTLERLLTAAVGAGRPLRLLIETKHPTRFGSGVEQRVVELLRRFGLADGAADAPVRVTVMSFSPLAVRRIRQIAPELDTVFLFEVTTPGLREGRAPFGAAILGPGLSVLRARPDLVARAHERGSRVFVWTVNTTSDVEYVHSLGVDGIITDRPTMALAHLRDGA